MGSIITATTKSVSQPSVKQVPFLDVAATYREFKDEIDSALEQVLESGAYILGPEVEAFEQEYAEYLGVRHCIALSSGLEALHVALRALGVGPGDEVIVPGNTYIATWLAVSYAGATPVPVEPDVRTYNMDPNRVEEAITARTRGIIAVHLYGQPAEMDALVEIAQRRGLWLMEDAAQAHGARYMGVRVGGLGDVGCWSFYPGKNLGAFGDGGAITTNRDDVADRVRVLRNYGSRIKYYNEMKGFNCRLDSVQAAVLRIKLRHLDEWNMRRQELARFYDEHLRDCGVVVPWAPDWVDPVHHLYVVRSGRRDALQQHMKARGIGTLVHYPVAPHLQKAYDDLGWAEGSLPVTEMVHREVLSLPMGPHVSREDAEAVVRAACEFVA